MDHHAAVGAAGGYDGYTDKYYAGRRSTSVYIPRFRNVTTKRPDYTRGFAYEVYTGRQGWQQRLDGAGHRRAPQGQSHASRAVVDLDGSLRRVPARATRTASR